MDTDSTAIVAMLARANILLDDALTAAELDRVEKEYQFEFADEHRSLLTKCLPIGTGWIDWRREDPAKIHGTLRVPLDGVLFDVLHNQFWPNSWGPRPSSDDLRSTALDKLARVPRLVPIFKHRFVPAKPAPTPAPVFSVHQTDVIYYGRSVEDFLVHEFLERGKPVETALAPYVPFWTELATGLEP